MISGYAGIVERGGTAMAVPALVMMLMFLMLATVTGA